MALGILKVKLVAEIWNFIRNFKLAKMTLLTFSKIGGAAIELLQTKMGKLAVAGAGLLATFAIGTRAIAKSLGPAIELQKEMANVATLLRDRAGESYSYVNKWVKTFTQNVINLSAEFGETTAATTKGLYDILSATIPASDAINVLTVAMRAARAGLTSTATATKAIISVLMSYNMAFDQAAKISDIFFATIRRGVTTFAELTPVIGRAAATAAAAGVSFEELMAAITTMTRAGLDTGVAITSINQTLLQFFRPTEDAIKAAARLGLNLDLTTLQTEGLVSVMEKLSDILPEQVGSMFRQMRALRGVNALIQQVTGFTKDYNVMLNAAGETQIAFEKQAKALSFSLDRLKQNFNALRIQGALPFLATARKIVEAINSIMGAMRKVAPGFAQFAGSLAAIGLVAAGLTGAILVTVAALSALGIAAGVLVGKMLLVGAVAASIYILIRGLIYLQKKFRAVTRGIDLFIRVLSAGSFGIKDVGKWISWLGDKITKLLRIVGLLRENWSELSDAKTLSAGLQALTESIDNTVKPTDDLQDRWKAVIEALQKGAPLTAEVKKGLDDLAESLKVTPVYSEETKEGLLGIVDAAREVTEFTPAMQARMNDLSNDLASNKYKNDQYAASWSDLLEQIARGAHLTDENRAKLVGMYEALHDNNTISGRLKDRITELSKELLETASISDAVRKKMKEMTDAFNKARATTARLRAAFNILGMDMPQHLEDIAKEADWAFNTIWKDGGYSADKLRDIWIDGFVPKLMDAFGQIPEKYREITEKMTGYTLEMVQGLSTLDVKIPSQLQDEARKAAEALLTVSQENAKLPKESQVSADIIEKAWEDVVEKIRMAFGEVPAEFEALAETVTNTSTEAINALHELGEEPLGLLKKKANEVLEAFIKIRQLVDEGVLDIDSGKIKDLWEGVKDSIEGAYGDFPDDLVRQATELQEVMANALTLKPEVTEDLRAEFKKLADEITKRLEKLPPAAQKVWREMLLIPELEKQNAVDTFEDLKDRIAANMTMEEWAEYKRLQPMIKAWERAFKDIRNMEDVSAEQRRVALQELLSEIEAAGAKYTDVWRRVYNALKLITESQVRTFKEIVEDVATEIRRELSNALEDLFEDLLEKDDTNWELVRLRMEDQKRDLRDQFVEGKISAARYYAEVSELDKQYNDQRKENMKGFQKFFTTIWDYMKKFWIKLLAEMLAEWLANQLKMAAQSVATATTQIAADTAAAEVGAVKSASGLPFPYNLAAIAVAVAAVAALIASVSEFAEGGIVTKPLLGMVGEAGPEAIVPLSHPLAQNALGGAGGKKEYNFQDTFVIQGPSMIDSREAWDDVYKQHVLPAKRRHIATLRNVTDDDIV